MAKEKKARSGYKYTQETLVSELSRTMQLLAENDRKKLLYNKITFFEVLYEVQKSTK